MVVGWHIGEVQPNQEHQKDLKTSRVTFRRVVAYSLPSGNRCKEWGKGGIIAYSLPSHRLWMRERKENDIEQRIGLSDKPCHPGHSKRGLASLKIHGQSAKNWWTECQETRTECQESRAECQELTDESKLSQEFGRVALLIGLLHCNRETDDIEQRTDWQVESSWTSSGV